MQAHCATTITMGPWYARQGSNLHNRLVRSEVLVQLSYVRAYKAARCAVDGVNTQRCWPRVRRSNPRLHGYNMSLQPSQLTLDEYDLGRRRNRTTSPNGPPTR
jgi:hypothetical protein